MAMQLNTDLLSVASFTPYQFPNDSAWMGHLPFANWIVNELKPATLVELGSHWGHSYFSFCQSVKSSGLVAKCYAVDTWQGDPHAGLYGDVVFNTVNSHNEINYANFSKLLRMTFDDALNYFSERSVNLLHIDGMHTYEAVKHDFESWLPKLAPGAVVLFHDTNVRERNFGVWRLWEELQVIYPNNIEFLHSHGLGVLQLNDAENTKKLSWLAADASEKKYLNDYFSALGAIERERFNFLQTRLHETNLKQWVSDRDTLIVSLNQSVSERDNQIVRLNQSVSERDNKIVSLNRSVSERDSQIAALRASSSWRLTKPLRLIKRFFKI